MVNRPSAFQPLLGIRVLDLSVYLPGPYLTRLLCDLGALVTKVEPPTGDPSRIMPPFKDGVSAVYHALNFGKESIAVNLKHEDGTALVRALAARSDVVVEAFRPGVLKRFGLDYASLEQLRPEIVMCSVSGYGQQGPLNGRAGHDLNYLARAGVLGLFGPAGSEPVVPGVQIADLTGGLSGALAVLGALLERQQTGVGRHLDISLARNAMPFAAVEFARRAWGGHEPRGEGYLTGGIPCYRVYRTADGRYMSLGALEPKFFTVFCQKAGVPELAGEGLTTGEEGRRVMVELEKLFAQRSQDEWVALLGESDCCCEPVRTPEEAAADVALGHTLLDGVGLISHLGAPAPSPHRASPRPLGAGHAEVAAAWGVEREVFDRARASGALVENP